VPQLTGHYRTVQCNFSEGKRKSRKALEPSGFEFGAPTGTAKNAVTRMDARFLSVDLKTYQHKYQQKEKCLFFGTA
jgi:hypothetical protein